MISAEKKADRLVDYPTVHDDELGTDIRGYQVVTDNNIVLGTVESLIVAEDTEMIRYVEVNTKYGIDNPASEADPVKNDEQYIDRFQNGLNYMLVPVGLADIRKDKKKVTVYGFNTDNLYTGPRHDQDFEIDCEYEYQVVNSYIKDKDSEFMSRYRKFLDEGKTGFDNHFYQKDYFRTRRNRDGKPNSPIL
jgi:hypothetical protein